MPVPSYHPYLSGVAVVSVPTVPVMVLSAYAREAMAARTTVRPLRGRRTADVRPPTPFKVVSSLGGGLCIVLWGVLHARARYARTRKTHISGGMKPPLAQNN